MHGYTVQCTATLFSAWLHCSVHGYTVPDERTDPSIAVHGFTVPDERTDPFIAVHGYTVPHERTGTFIP